MVAYIRSSAILGLQMIMLARGSCSTCKDVSRRETGQVEGTCASFDEITCMTRCSSPTMRHVACQNVLSKSFGSTLPAALNLERNHCLGVSSASSSSSPPKQSPVELMCEYTGADSCTCSSVTVCSTNQQKRLEVLCSAQISHPLQRSQLDARPWAATMNPAQVKCHLHLSFLKKQFRLEIEFRRI